ncbi:MAG: hypothetical protein ACE5EO_05420 [Candidatus Krumholzibacteriia bacterium]
MTGLSAFVFSFAISYIGTVLLLRIRLRSTFIDVPSERSSHEVPKPRFGGIAIVGAFTLVYLFLLFIRPGMAAYLPLAAGGVIVFTAGLLDDRRSLPVYVRFLAQGAAVAVVMAAGHYVDHIFLPLVGTIDLGPLAVPFTALFVLASINFYNFVDGVDGLAAGSAFIVATFLALIAYMLGHVPLALLCLVLAGGSVGFLQFNFPPSRLFMGDGGSTFLGFVFACVAIMGNGLSPEIPFFIPVLMLSSLFLDAGLTLAKRALKGERIFQPHHTHYYQRLLSLGLNHKQVTVLEYALTILLGSSALIFFKAGGFFPFFLTLCWVIIFTALILKIRGLERGDRLFWERRTVLVVAGDLLVTGVAYFGGYFLRMNFRFTEAEGVAVLKAFPLVLVVRSACFYYYGLYRGVWKYTSTPDVVRIVKAVASGSAIIVVLLVLFYRFVAFPRSLFIIEFFLLTSALLGTRFASRLFHEFGKETLSGNIKRVAVIGAGDYGERIGREIRNTHDKSVSVVCYIDDDEDKQGLALQGTPIRGPLARLAAICREYAVDSLVLGISSLPDARLYDVVNLARAAGVSLETRDTRYLKKPEPGAVLFDRISRGMNRTLPLHNGERSNRFYPGKRVLLTHGGHGIGPAMAKRLSGLGARVTVQVDSPWDIARFGPLEAGGCTFYIGRLEETADAVRIVESCNPQVVFHCVSVHAAPAVNKREFLWRSVVRSTDALVEAVAGHPVESIVLISFWENVSAADDDAKLLSVSEARMLNSPGIPSPQVIRVATILTERRLLEILEDTSPAGVGSGESFSVFDPEAVALCVDAAAGASGRALIVPRIETPVGERDLKNFFREGSLDKKDEGRPAGERSTLFPAEAIERSAIPGASVVVGPLYPAGGELMAAVEKCLRAPRDVEDSERVRLLGGLHTLLCTDPARGIRASIE